MSSNEIIIIHFFSNTNLYLLQIYIIKYIIDVIRNLKKKKSPKTLSFFLQRIANIYLQLGTPITKQRLIIDPAYTSTGNREEEEEEEEAIKKRLPGSNGEARGLFAGGPHWLFGPRIIIVAVALPFVSARLPPLTLISAGRCIATRTGLSLHPADDEEASHSQPSDPRTEKGESQRERAKEKEVDADRSGGERRTERRPPLGTRQMRRGTREVRGKSENLAGERENGRKYRVGRRYAARCSSSRRCESTRSSLCFPPPFLIGSFLRPAGLLFRAPTAPDPP